MTARSRSVFLSMILVALWGALSPADEPQGLPARLLAEVSSPRELPPGRYAEAGVWDAVGPLGRLGGRVVDDAETHSGKAWEVRVPASAPDDGKRPSATLFGPYANVARGTYVAFFRIKLLGDEIDSTAAHLDAAVDGGKKALSVLPLGVGDLVRDRYVQVALGFEHPGGRLECRVHWAGLASLRVDRVALYRLTGAGLGLLTGRVAPPHPSGKPCDLTELVEPRPYPDVFPRSQPPARRLWVVDLRPLAPDWQLCLITLQGIVNRTQPEIYCLLNQTDPQWLDNMRQRGWIESTQTISGPELVQRFRQRLKGVIVTDPALPASKHVATMLAGLDDCAVVSPRLAAELKLPVREDLRGRWTTSVAAYRWALGLWPRMDHHVVACYWPDNVAAYDYFVQHKVFLFWISGCLDGARKYSRPQEEVELVEQLLAKMPANSAVMGFPWAGDDVGIGETGGVTLFAEFAKYLVGAVDCTNLSVHSGLRVPPLVQKKSPPPPPPLDPRKIYVSVILSDGDNLPVLSLHNFPQCWKDPVRGSFPMGWTMSPSASLLLPDIVDYYYRTASPQDCFVAAVSGVGYTYPDSYARRYPASRRMAIYDEFLDQTRVGMERSDQHVNWIMGATRPELIERYAQRIARTEAIFPDYGRVVAGYEDATYPTARNVGVFHAVNNWREGASDEEQIARTVAQVRAFTPSVKPAFLHLFIWNWGFKLPMIGEVLRRLGPDYVAVRPDQMAALYRTHVARQQVLAQLPAAMPVIAGQRAVIVGRVQNTSSETMTVQLRVASGLGHVELTPSQATLASAESVALRLSGVPTADRMTVECHGPFGVRQWEIALASIRPEEIVGRLPEKSRLLFQKHFSSALLAHHGGRSVPDAQANDGETWLAEPGRDLPGHIVFGPYRETPPGKYVALFRMKRTGDATGEVARIDAAVASGPSSASARVTADQLPAGQYRYVLLRFVHPGGRLETRVYWPGKAAMAVEGVTLWREETD